MVNPHLQIGLHLKETYHLILREDRRQRVLFASEGDLLGDFVLPQGDAVEEAYGADDRID